MEPCYRADLARLIALLPEHPAFDVDWHVIDSDIIPTLYYMAFSGQKRAWPHRSKLLAVSTDPDNLPTSPWAVVWEPRPRLDDPVLRAAIFGTVELLGGGSSAARLVSAELEAYGIQRTPGDLRQKDRLKRSRQQLEPEQLRVATALANCLAHSIDDSAWMTAAIAQSGECAYKRLAVRRVA